MSDANTIKRQLKIKSGSVKRILKEHTMYRNECTQQKLKVDKFVADGAEEWDIKNGNRMLEESQKMVDDSAARLGKAVGELRDLIVSVRSDEQFKGDEALQEAEDVLEEAST